MVIMFTVVSLGFVAVVVILLNEQIAKKVLAKKVAAHDEANLKSRQQSENQKAEIEKLSFALQESLKINQRLTQSIDQKNELITKYQAAGVNLIAEKIDQTKLSDIMASTVISIHFEAPFSEVARKMQQNDIRHLPVIDDESKIVGIITQRMLYQIRSPRKLIDGEWYYDEEILNDVILKNVMEKEVITLQPHQSVGKALMKMAFSKCGGIPIVDDQNKLVGIVTRKDLLKFAAGIYQHKIVK